MLRQNCGIHANDTGIFVYEPSVIKSRELSTDLFYEEVHQRVEVLRDALNINFELKLKQLNYGTDIVCLDDQTKEDFIQFCFHFCNAKQGIYVDQLTLPSHLIRKGIGTFCVKWLKDSASAFGFKYIVLGSVAEARTFWTKMGFRILTSEELHNFPGYQGRYSR
ncbi:hypothetical protein [Desulfosporosinus sp.]|uniref:hypothetical protein n=1 Tax=Desulfosporosinus sp. TaxID=157907 RepID=UPI0025BDB7CF|nr:hypothetical protein [Desulfosporosinus sp.]MBC2725449.1 hypothetical protein [Desulfosporosinus sp.]